MTDYSTETPSLGIGAILGDTTSLLLSNFLAACGIALIPIGIGMVISTSLFGVDIATGQNPAPTDFDQDFYTSLGVMFLFQLVSYSIATAMLVSFAYDVKLGRPKRISAYISRVVSNIIPLIVLSLAAYIVIMIGMGLFVIPGLWAYAVFSVVAPVIVVEAAGFRALGRSAALTKDYRWPIVGLLIVMLLIVIVVSAITGFIVGFIATLISSPILVLGLNIVSSTVGFAFACIMIALLYARLREIKEGVSVDHLADVFS